MKLRPLILTVLLFGQATLFSAAPDSLDGYIYYEGGRTIARTDYNLAQIHASDGTFAGLYRHSTSPGASIETSKLLQPTGGTYLYRRLDDLTAELTLSESTFSGKRTLRFTSETAGTVSLDAIGGIGLTFRLVPVAARPPLANCSNRSFVSATTPAFAGFVITGEVNRTVLVRAVGPGMAPFGITDFLRNPNLTIFRTSTNAVVASNDDWSSENAESISRTSITVGAFPLPTASKDAATILVLPPGAYIAQVNSTDVGDSGQALIEIYILP